MVVDGDADGAKDGGEDADGAKDGGEDADGVGAAVRASWERAYSNDSPPSLRQKVRYS